MASEVSLAYGNMAFVKGSLTYLYKWQLSLWKMYYHWRIPQFCHVASGICHMFLDNIKMSFILVHENQESTRHGSCEMNVSCDLRVVGEGFRSSNARGLDNKNSCSKVNGHI